MATTDPQQPGGWPQSGSSGYAPPGYASASPAVPVRKTRPWLVALTATAVMLVLIGAIGNPPVTRAIANHSANSTGFWSLALRSLGSYHWDFGRLSPDPGHFYLSYLIGDIVILVLVFLLVLALSSGSASFGRVFLATWVSVIVASMIGAYVRAAILDSRLFDTGKANEIFFSAASPGPGQLFASIVFGFVVAVIAAIVAAATRRTEVVTTPEAPGAAAPAATEPPPRREPWTAPPAAVPGPTSNPSPWTTETGAERTTQLPAADSPGGQGSEDDQHTTQLPSVDSPGSRGDDDEQHTAQLPPDEGNR